MMTSRSTSLSACGVPYAYEPKQDDLVGLEALGDFARIDG